MADNTQINDFFDLAAFAEQAQIVVNECSKTAAKMQEAFKAVRPNLNSEGLNEFAKAAAKVQEAQTKAKQVMTDFEKAQQKLIKSQGDYNRDLERLDELLKADAQSTAAMAAQNKALEQIRRNLSRTDENYAATVQKIIDKQNANVKAMRDFQTEEQKRTANIGKYKEAIEEAMNASGNYRAQLKSLTNAMVEVEQSIIAAKEAHVAESSEVQTLQAQYDKLQQQAAKVKDAQNDMQARIRYLADDYGNFNAVLQGMQGVTALGQGIAGVTSLMGVNSQAVERSIQVMMSLQSIMNALNTVQKIFNKDSRVMVMLQQLKTKGAKQEAVAMQGAATATTAEAAATTGATAATRGFTAALMSNPFGLIAVAVATLTTAIIGLTGAMDDSTAATDENSESVQKNTEKWKDNMSARREALRALSGGLLSTIEDKGLDTFEREAAILEFVTQKLGLHVNGIEDAKKAYNGFKNAVGGITMSMDVIEADGTRVHRAAATLRDAALSLVNARANLKELQDQAAEMSADESDEEKNRMTRVLQTYEAYVMYAQNMYDVLENKTVGAYKNMKAGSKEVAKATKEVKDTTKLATEAQLAAVDRAEKLMAVVNELQVLFMRGEITAAEYEERLAKITFSAQVEEIQATIAALNEQNETLGENTEEYVKNSEQIAKLQKQLNDLNFKNFRDELEKNKKAAKDSSAAVVMGISTNIKWLQAVAKKGMEQMLEVTQRVMDTVQEIGDEMNASIAAVSESIFEAQTARLSKEQDEMAQHYELQRAYIEANVHDEEERQQKLAQLALEEANAKAIAARKEAEVERKKAKVDLAITTAKASADIAAAIAAAVLTAAAGGEAYTVAVRIAAAVAAVLSAGAAVASAAAKINSIPAFERGGEAKRGLVFRAGERGYEVGQGVSGRTYLFPRDGVYVAPEPIRIHPHSESVQMVNNYNKAVTLRNSLTVKVIDNKRIEKYFAI